MRFVKPRKPRGTKLNGERSFNFCTGCYSPFCDPFLRPPNVDRRLRAGLCPACGKPKDRCGCKSSLDAKRPVMVTHNNRKGRRC